MNTHHHEECIRVLIADDDEHILECYREAFEETEMTDQVETVDALAAELFDPVTDVEDTPKFKVVACIPICMRDGPGRSCQWAALTDDL